MAWVFGIAVVLVLGGIAAVAAGRGGEMTENDRDLPPPRVPESGPLTAQHLRHVRFPLALRGYRMADVDAVLSRVAEQLEATDPPRAGEQQLDPHPARSEHPESS